VTATYSIEKSAPNAQGNGNADPSNLAIQNQISDTISKYAARTGKAGADAILTSLDTEAQKLTDVLFPADGLRKRGPAEVDAIGQSISAVVAAAKQAINTQFQQSEPELRQITAQAMSSSNRNGWFYAVLYQRILVNATSARDGIRKGISVSASPASRDLAAWGCVVSGSWAVWKTTCSNELEVFFKQYASDVANLDQMSGTFLNSANRDSGLGANSSEIAAIRGAGMGWGRLTDWILGMMGQNNEGNSLNGEGWADPIPQLQTTGGAMLAAGGTLVTAAKGGEIAAESAVGKANILAFIGGKMLEMLGPLGWLLVAIGFLLAVVVPYMPLIYFFLAALSWLILAVQTIITAPFWLMQMFYPNRDGSLQGTSIARALMVLLALLMRPALIIIGLIFCMLLMRVGLDFLNILTRNAYAAMAYAGPISAGGQLGNIALAIGGFMIYASAAVALVSICCGLIDGVGDAVMDGVDAGMSRVLGSQAQRGEGMLGNPAAAAAAQIAIGGRGSLAGTGNQVSRLRQQRESKQLSGTGGKR
jgi:conjugal transfer/type IV secretion protein DotA/TraY